MIETQIFSSCRFVSSSMWFTLLTDTAQVFLRMSTFHLFISLNSYKTAKTAWTTYNFSDQLLQFCQTKDVTVLMSVKRWEGRPQEISLGLTVLHWVQPSLLSRDLVPSLVATHTNNPGLESQISYHQVVVPGPWSIQSLLCISVTNLVATPRPLATGLVTNNSR